MMGMIENSSTSKLNYSYVPRNYECCSLSEWISMHPAETDMQKVFLNMDIALKYIHDHDYCIADFSPSAPFPTIVTPSSTFSMISPGIPTS